MGLVLAQEEPLLQKPGYQLEAGPDKLAVVYFDGTNSHPVGEIHAEKGLVSKVVPTPAETVADLPKSLKSDILVVRFGKDVILCNGEQRSLTQVKDRMTRYANVLRLTNSRGMMLLDVRSGVSMLELLELLQAAERHPRLAMRFGEDEEAIAKQIARRAASE